MLIIFREAAGSEEGHYPLKKDIGASDQDRQRSRVGERVPRHLGKKCIQKFLLSSSSGTIVLQGSRDNDGT